MGRASAPEPPRWTLMVNHNGRIVAVRQEQEAAYRRRGWLCVARETEMLPFNGPHWPDVSKESHDGSD